MALNRHDGKEIWKYDTRQDGRMTSFHGDPVVIGDTVVTGSDISGTGGPSHTYAFDITTGRLIWKRSGSALESDLIQAAAYAVGRCSNGDLLGINVTNGEQVWCRKPLDYTYPFSPYSSPTAKGDTAVFGGVDGIVYSVDGKTGDIIWSHDAGNTFTTAVALDSNDVYVGMENHNILRLSLRDGKKLGSIHLDNYPFGTPVISKGRIMVVTSTGTLVALSRDLSTKIWKKESSFGWLTRRPLVWRDLVLIGKPDGTVCGFQIDNGEMVLELTLKGVIRGLGAYDDVLYIGTEGGTLFACRPKLE